MTEKPENQYAFPVSTIDGFTEDGMTLRDWFAGQALAGLLTLEDHHHRSASGTASEAYAYADAMLTERSKTGERS